MVTHWLRSPVNGYLGSSYGSTLSEMLQTPMAAGRGDAFLSKLRGDVPVIGAADPASINLFVTDEAPDRRRILIGVGADVIVAG